MQPDKNGKLTLEFLWSVGITLVCIGIAFGTLKVTISSVSADVTKQDEEIKSIKVQYVRMDVYEAKHQALTDQLKDIATDVKDIKRYFLIKQDKIH